MDGEKLSFEDAGAKLGLKTQKTGFISRTEAIEEAGESPILAQALTVIKPGEVSKPIPSQKGIIIVKIAEADKIDEEKFASKKEEYRKKALVTKKSAYLEGWLRSLEEKTTLNIDFNDYDKYFK